MGAVSASVICETTAIEDSICQGRRWLAKSLIPKGAICDVLIVSVSKEHTQRIRAKETGICRRICYCSRLGPRLTRDRDVAAVSVRRPRLAICRATVRSRCKTDSKYSIIIRYASPGRNADTTSCLASTLDSMEFLVAISPCLLPSGERLIYDGIPYVLDRSAPLLDFIQFLLCFRYIAEELWPRIGLLP